MHGGKEGGMCWMIHYNATDLCVMESQASDHAALTNVFHFKKAMTTNINATTVLQDSVEYTASSCTAQICEPIRLIHSPEFNPVNDKNWLLYLSPFPQLYLWP